MRKGIDEIIQKIISERELVLIINEKNFYTLKPNFLPIEHIKLSCRG